MARTRKALPAKVDVAHLISTGVLAGVCPRPLIDEVLQETERGSQRERLLPAPAVVYYVMAMALWREAPLEEVLRVMALDGSCMDVADERANAEYFGYPAASRGQSAFPQARVLGLVECGTHVIVSADIAPYARSENSMAAERLPSWLRKDMLVMADRGFYSFKLWTLACLSGAALLWRVSSTIKLPAQQVLSDGSYLSTVFDSEDTARRHGRTVRVVEYTLADSAVPTQDSYRLVTTLLDPEQAPGQELAALYHERWEIEGVFDEFKTHLRASSTVLRSKTPDLVRQKLWGLLLAHFAIRQLMAQAAWQRALTPIG